MAKTKKTPQKKAFMGGMMKGAAQGMAKAANASGGRAMGGGQKPAMGASALRAMGGGQKPAMGASALRAMGGGRTMKAGGKVKSGKK